MTNDESNMDSKDRGGHAVFPRALKDFVMCDSNQDRLFASIGCTPRPFAGMADWPWLDELLVEKSRALLNEVGSDQWRQQGGKHDEDGEPTFRKNVP